MTRRPWKCRSVESQENQTQVFLPFHRPWKSLRDSHIPTASTMTPLSEPSQSQNQKGARPTPYPSGSSFDEKMLPECNALSLVCEMSA